MTGASSHGLGPGTAVRQTSPIFSVGKPADSDDDAVLLTFEDDSATVCSFGSPARRRPALSCELGP
jgi:hypothetical protein